MSKLYDPLFLPEESDDLLDYLDLGDAVKGVPTTVSLADFAYEHGLGEMQLRDMLKQSVDGKTITVNGKVIAFRKDEDEGRR